MSAPANAIGEALATALVHSTWQIAAVAAVLWGALRFTHESSARIRYALGCGALAAAVSLPLATFTGTLSSADATHGQSIVQPGQSRTISPSRQGISSGATPHPRSASDALVTTAETWIVPLWLAGVAVCSLRLVLAAQYARTMRRISSPAPSPIIETVQRLAAGMNVRRRVDVMVTAVAGSPGTIGWLKPMILLPAAALSGLTPVQLEAILAHEIAHIRRHDYLVNLLQMASETAFFYHPAVWWISSRIRFERELCCDEAAVHASGDVVTYAHALAAVARQSLAPDPGVSAATLSLPERMRRLLVPQRRTPAATTASVAAAAVLALGLVAASATWVHGQNSTRRQADELAALTLTVIDPLGKPARGVPLVFEQGAFQDGEVFGDGVTDRDGRYVARLPAGTYLFSALIDFFPGTEVTLKAGERVERQVRMKLEAVTGSFTVCIDCESGIAPAEGSVAEDLQRDRAEYATALTRTAEPVGGWEQYQIAVPAALRNLDPSVQGSVTATGRVRQNGRLVALQIVSSAHPALASATRTALESQRWEPARVGNTIVEVDFVLDLQFVRRTGQTPVVANASDGTQTVQRGPEMRTMTTPVVQWTGALAIAAASVSAGHAQSPEGFRVTSAIDRPRNLPPATAGLQTSLFDSLLEMELERAFKSKEALTDLSVSASVTFKQLNRAEYAVPVTVRIAPSSELAVGRGERSRLDFIAAITDDPYGITLANLRDATELTLDTAAIPALATTPIIYEAAPFTLLPGRYILRVVARDQTTGRIGSTTMPFTIPNLARQQGQK